MWFKFWHYSAFIILNYPNNTDVSLDIIPQLINSNKNIENDFSINFEGTLNIENNLFGYVYIGTRILDYPNDISLKNISNENTIERNSILSVGNNVSLLFNSNGNYEKKNYTIEYAYVLREPNYDEINNNNYLVYTDETYGNIRDKRAYYNYYEYSGKSSYYEIIISEELISNCNDDLCALCFTNNTCITCKYNYAFINEGKICLKEDSKSIINVYNPEENIDDLQKKYKNLTFIDLGKYIEKLKNSYNLPLETKLNVVGINTPLLNGISAINNFHFEIYLENGTKLNDFSACSDEEVYIISPITNKELIRFDKALKFKELGYEAKLQLYQLKMYQPKKKIMKKAIFHQLKKVGTKKMYQPRPTWYKNLYQPVQPFLVVYIL